MLSIDRRRRVVSAVFVATCAAAVGVALVPLGFILFFVLRQGLPGLSLTFFTHMPKPVGESGGGMANAIVGTLLLISMAALIAVPVGVLCGVFVSEFKDSRLAAAA